jgi:putative hydrolase of the HAD superfamily
MPDIEAVFLDVGGVFNLPAVAETGKFLAQHGADGSLEAIERCHYHGMAAYDDARGGDGARVAPYLTGFLAAAGLDVGLVDEFDAAIRGAGWGPAIRASLEALPALAATGVRLAIVSNSDGTVEARLGSAGVAQVGPGRGVAMLAIIDSGAVGVAKPDPRIFTFALDACGVTPDRAVHVGDSRYADVGGARAAGIRPLHIDPYEICTDRTHDHVRTLWEVVRMTESG